MRRPCWQLQHAVVRLVPGPPGFSAARTCRRRCGRSGPRVRRLPARSRRGRAGQRGRRRAARRKGDQGHGGAGLSGRRGEHRAIAARAGVDIVGLAIVGQPQGGGRGTEHQRQARAGGRRSGHAAAVGAARRAGHDRHQVRLRRGRLRRLHGPRRRPGRAVLRRRRSAAVAGKRIQTIEGLGAPASRIRCRPPGSPSRCRNAAIARAAC